MKVIILLAGFGTRMRPHTWSRPKPLLKVAGNTVVGHLLDLMRDVTTEEVIFVVGYKGEQIEAWIRQNYPHLKTHFVTQADPRGQAHAVWLCRDYLQEDHDVVVAFGDGIIDADYAHFAADHADGVLLVQEVDDPRRFGIAMRDENGYVTRCVEKPVTTDQKMAIVGINWFRSGRQLLGALETVLQNENPFKGEYWMVDAYNVMLEQGARFVTRPVLEWEDAGTP
ncbi:MAG: nucleotidyltransferase family protein, partial [Chloroflexota bacterium]